jgi:hypothetical protein
VVEVIAAFVLYVLHNRLPLLIGSIVVAVLVLVSGALMPFEWFCSLWAAVLIVGVTAASLHDTGDGAE